MKQAEFINGKWVIAGRTPNNTPQPAASVACGCREKKEVTADDYFRLEKTLLLLQVVVAIFSLIVLAKTYNKVG